MTARIVYVDSSALVKLIVPEPETAALLRYLATTDVQLASRLAVVEVGRAAGRRGGDATRAIAVLDQVTLVDITPDIADRAAGLAPADLRTLDALHVATAIEFRPQLAAFVTYDTRQTAAARRHGLEVATPA